MAVRSAGAFAQPLRTLFRVGAVGGLSDRELLDRFENGQGEDAEAAFRALMDRHGPMVLRACRVVLDDPHDAEDAFQATFLILARHGGSIRDRGSVASWLHRIAWRIAARARAAAARRREIERQSARLAAGPIIDPERHLLDMILHEEVVRLPEKYRIPIVLCYLEGLTHERAAEHLGWPVGTVRGRLAQARDLLRARLTRRGVTAPAALVGAGWFSATSPAGAAVSAALADTTVEAVLQVASGQTVVAVVSAAVAAMMGDASRVLALARCTAVAGVLLLVGAIGIGSGWAMGRPSAMQQPSLHAEHTPQAPSPKDHATDQTRQDGIVNTGGQRSSSQPVDQGHHDVTIKGTVVDDQGKPVADAQIVVHASVPWGSKMEPVEARATTGADGRFRLVIPALRAVYISGRVWAFRPGLAYAVAPVLEGAPRALILHKPAPTTITIEGPDGRPVAGARVSPRVILLPTGNNLVTVPDSVADPRAVTTGPDGKATVDFLAGGARLVAVRVTAESIGTQDFQLIGRFRGVDLGATNTLRLKPTSHLSGRVRNRAGEPIANQPVEVWLQGGIRLESSRVRFKNGSLRTAADGSFQTPDNLLVGSSYRVAVLAPGMEPILSDWITIGEQPRVLLPMIQRPLRTVSGRVVDRQGKPLVGIEVFQSGDGPERTATQTDATGHFKLGGFRQGSVFLFARGDRFRFSGRLIKPGDRDITVELTRTNERPALEMRMLPDAIPLEESRALARRLLEPYLDDFEEKSDATKTRALQLVATADPVRVLGMLETVQLANPRFKAGIETDAAVALARTDPARAEAVADAMKAPDLRVMASLAVVDALPDQERERKLALLDRAANHTRAEAVPLKRLYHVGEVAERWYELGEEAKAKALFADGLRLADQVANKTASSRGYFAARLARVDLPAALAIAKELPAAGNYSASWALRNIALRLAADNPALAEGVLRQLRPEPGQDWLPPAIAWKMAKVDPVRARRLVEESQRHFEHPQMYLFLALGLKPRDPAAAHQAFETAILGIDRLMKEDAAYSSTLGARQVLLPLVEQIDPALVPEYFWRVVAARPSLGNPRPTSAISLSQGLLVVLLAWYDRAVAAALFEPARTWMDHADDRELARAPIEFEAWSTFDPRAAVARLERVPVSPNLALDADLARRDVADTLGLAHEERWRRTWTDFTEMGSLFKRDLR